MSKKLNSSFKAWLVCITASMYFFYYFVQLMLFNTISHDLIKTFWLNSVAFGTLSSLLLWGTLPILLPAGLLLDRFSTKKIMLFGLSLMTIATFVFSRATDLFFLEVCRVFVGVGSAFALLSCLRLIAHWFPANKLAFASGIAMTIGFLGGMVGQTPMAILVSAFGWRDAVLVDAVLGLVLLLLIFFIVRDYPNGYIKPQIEKSKLKFFIRNLKKAAINRQNWLIGLYTSFLNLPVFVLSAAFGNLYLIQVFNLTKVQASFANTLLVLGIMIGSPLFGWFSDKMNSRKKPMIIGAILSIGLILILIYSQNLSVSVIYILFFLLGFITTTQVIGYPAIAESNTRETISTGTGIASLLVMGGGAVFIPFFGWLLNMNGAEKIISGVPVHTAAQYHLAMLSLPIAFFAGLIAIIFARETFSET